MSALDMAETAALLDRFAESIGAHRTTQPFTPDGLSGAMKMLRAMEEAQKIQRRWIDACVVYLRQEQGTSVAELSGLTGWSGSLIYSMIKEYNGE